MSCPDLRGAFERLTRYLRILSDALTMVLSEDRGRFRVTFELDGGSRPVPRQRTEFILITVTTFCRWVSGRDVNPSGVEVAYPPPGSPALYREKFGCPVSFDAPVSSLAFALDDMTRPLPTSNPQLADLHDRYAGDYLERFNQAETSYRVREAIVRRLPDGEPRREQVARDLAMSERTLQRRLEEEATSFHRLLDDTRRELAEQHLGRLQLSLVQAAYLLGFADQRSFFRACRRWFGQAPGQYRDHLHRLRGVVAGSS
jgi:AraC-like DNA-binding protein